MNAVIGLILMLIFSANHASNLGVTSSPNMDISTEVEYLSQKAPTLDKKVLKFALRAYRKAKASGEVKKPILAVIDYSKPSKSQRLWVFDLHREKLLFNTHVAHGVNSGGSTPNHFSNQISSKESSIGTYITQDTYIGSKGYSLNIKGLEKGFNSNAYTRRVVIHGAWYVKPDFIKSHGQAGRSWGCPAIAPELVKPIINTLKNGSVIFAYYPDKQYMAKSHYL